VAARELVRDGFPATSLPTRARRSRLAEYPARWQGSPSTALNVAAESICSHPAMGKAAGQRPGASPAQNPIDGLEHSGTFDDWKTTLMLVGIAASVIALPVAGLAFAGVAGAGIAYGGLVCVGVAAGIGTAVIDYARSTRGHCSRGQVALDLVGVGVTVATAGRLSSTSVLTSIAGTNLTRAVPMRMCMSTRKEPACHRTCSYW
jgi:hypothetical protein